LHTLLLPLPEHEQLGVLPQLAYCPVSITFQSDWGLGWLS
jgi:hypothetical protein